MNDFGFKEMDVFRFVNKKQQEFVSSRKVERIILRKIIYYC
jgi:hypothetical protein